MGKDLCDVLEEIYERYGHTCETQFSYKIREGAGRKMSLTDHLRKNSCELPFKIIKVTDYLKDDTGLPITDLMSYDLEGGDWFCVRPSGTEPKVKIYVGTKGRNTEEAEDKNKKITGSLTEFFDKMNG